MNVTDNEDQLMKDLSRVARTLPELPDDHAAAVRALRQDLHAPARIVNWIKNGEKNPQPVESPQGLAWNEKFSRLCSLFSLNPGALVLVCGEKTHTGKTTLAVSVLWTLTEQLKTARYVTLQEILMELSDARYRGEWSSTFESFVDPLVLAIDQLDEQFRDYSDHKACISLLQARDMAGRGTILVSGRARTQIAGLLGSSVCAKLNAARGGIIEANWDSFL